MPRRRYRRQPDAETEAELTRAGEDVLRLGEIVARIEQALNLRAVACPLLDLVEVAVVRIERVARVSSSDH